MYILQHSVRTILTLTLLVTAGEFVFLQAQTDADCLGCHSDPGLTMERRGREVSLFVDEALLKRSTHGKLSCVACHVGFDPFELPHRENIQPLNCTTCHSNPAATHAFHPRMLRASGRNGTADVSCKGCHGTHGVESPRVAGTRFHKSRLTELCGTCHATVKETFVQSAHARALAEGIRGAPDCMTCHRKDITSLRPGRDSVQLKIAQEKMCLSCHLDDPDVRARVPASAEFIAAYEQSAHGRLLLAGNAAAANCIDCHGSHEIKKTFDLSALVYKSHLSETCGTCHGEIAREFKESIHGVALAKGNRDAPVCTTCHGEHNILSPKDPRSPVAPLNVSGQVCSPCHTSLRLSERYGLTTDRFRTFSDSYHGLAIRAGSVEVANCASCHGAHNIKPSTDPTSMVHKDNIAATCGSCHPGANERFAVGRVHVVMTREEEPLLYWIATVYIILIVVVVGGMFVHNALDFIKKARRRLMIRQGLIEEQPVGRGLYLRMTLNERFQHGSLTVSFIVLVITGFMLRYPEAWWVVWIRSLSDSVFDLRSLLHRIAGVVMIAVSVYHLGYVFMTERGKQLICDLRPHFQDVRDALAVMKYNLGISNMKPRFGRFSYIEKSEYWALVWGTIIMAVTGVIMWFENTFMGLLTKLGWDVAATIHFYEAWLATLAIVVWHFYYVIFNPDVYPMNPAWLTGHLTEAEMAEEHPLELEEMKRKEMEEGQISIVASGEEYENGGDEKTPPS